MTQEQEDRQLSHIYDRFLRLMVEMIQQGDAQMVSGTMMALALRLYRTTLSDEDFNKMIAAIQASADTVTGFDQIKPQQKKLH